MSLTATGTRITIAWREPSYRIRIPSHISLATPGDESREAKQQIEREKLTSARVYLIGEVPDDPSISRHVLCAHYDTEMVGLAVGGCRAYVGTIDTGTAVDLRGL